MKTVRRVTVVDAKKKIIKRIGKKVAFNYPAGEKTQARNSRRPRGGPEQPPIEQSAVLGHVVDLIRFRSETHRHWIRIGYYRITKGRLQWGSQTTICEPIGTWEKLLVGAATQKPWFRDLLLRAAGKVKK